MYLAFATVIFTMMASIFMVSYMSSESGYKLKRSMSGDKSTITNQYSKDNQTSSFKGSTYVLQEATVEKEIITKTLIRTCYHLQIKARVANCPNPISPTTVWSFAGTVNGTGDLLPAWTGGTASAFSCANIDAFGRGLIQRALPVSFMQGKNYRYDFTGMVGADRSDPCAYTEIVDTN